MHTNSIQTEFYDDNDYIASVPSRSITSHKKIKQEVHIANLQDMINQYNKKIKTNKPLIQQLQCQRKFFKRLSQKQKQKIQSVNIEQIKNQYQKKMNKLKQQRQQLHQTIARLHQQSQKTSLSYQNTLRNVLQNRQFFIQKLSQAEQQNKIYEKLYQQKSEQVQKLGIKVTQKQKILVQKQIISNKYKDLVKQIQRVQGYKRKSDQTSNFQH